MSTNSPRERLRAAIDLLAAGAQQQIRYLIDLGVAPSADELALEFDASLDAAQAYSVVDALPPGVAQLKRALAEMSGQDHVLLWNFDALAAAPEWERVRRLAGSTLDEPW